MTGRPPKTTEQFIHEIESKFGNTLDTSDVIYKNNKTPVLLSCHIHGPFSISPSALLRSPCGCKTCSFESMGTKIRSNLGEFISKANIKHNSKYIYDLVKYSKSNEHVTIICPIHGEFEQVANEHLKGRGCKLCGTTLTTTKITKSQSQFEHDANTIHQYKYSYTSAKYVNNYTKIDIICPTHGVFAQEPTMHLLGQGCSNCKTSTGENDIRTWLSHINEPFIAQYTFSDCTDRRKLPFDFYCPNLNLCIEFHGGQHYKSVKYFGGDSAFTTRQYHDKIKMEYCQKDNTPNLLVIPHWEQSNIADIITKEILKIRGDAASICTL